MVDILPQPIRHNHILHILPQRHIWLPHHITIRTREVITTDTSIATACTLSLVDILVATRCDIVTLVVQMHKPLLIIIRSLMLPLLARKRSARPTPLVSLQETSLSQMTRMRRSVWRN